MNTDTVANFYYGWQHSRYCCKASALSIIVHPKTTNSCHIQCFKYVTVHIVLIKLVVFVSVIYFALSSIQSELANITGKSPKMFHSGTEDYLQQKLQDESDSNEDNSNGSLLVSLLFYLKFSFPQIKLVSCEIKI